MTGPRNIISPFSRFVGLEKNINRSGQKLILPFYHLVSDNSPVHIRQLYPVRSIKSFEEDIEYLLDNFQPLSPEVFRKDFIPEELEKPSFLLSFDDGLRETKEYIIPILKRKGISAIFFVNNHFIGNKDLFYRYKASVLSDYLVNIVPPASILKGISSELNITSENVFELRKGILKTGYNNRKRLDKIATYLNLDFEKYLDEVSPYLDEVEIMNFIRDGFYIGAHSLDHPLFSELGEEEQYTQVKQSLDDLSGRFGIDYRFFAFPFTDNGAERRIFSSDHLRVDAVFGTAGLKRRQPGNYFQRLPMEISGKRAQDIIKTEYFYFNLKKICHKVFPLGTI